MINLFLPDNIYVIRRKDLFNPHFFLYDWIDTAHLEIDAIVWTPNKFKAREFYTEESVETFLFDKVKNRPCEIIMVK